jgi:hypothetical protein
MAFDMDALAARVRAKREATGLGLNVRFIDETGERNEFSFASADRAEAFRDKLRRAGRELLA